MSALVFFALRYNFSSISKSTQSSLSTWMTYSPVELSIPVWRATALPPLCSKQIIFVIDCLLGYVPSRFFRISTLRSFEASSTKRYSISSNVCSNNVRAHSSIYFSRLYTVTMTETFGIIILLN